MVNRMKQQTKQQHTKHRKLKPEHKSYVTKATTGAPEWMELLIPTRGVNLVKRQCFCTIGGYRNRYRNRIKVFSKDDIRCHLLIGHFVTMRSDYFFFPLDILKYLKSFWTGEMVIGADKTVGIYYANIDFMQISHYRYNCINAVVFFYCCLIS